MFANVLSGVFSIRFLLPVITLLSAGGYGYYLHTNKSSLKTELEIANAHIATFDAEIANHKDEIVDRNKLIDSLEKEIEKRNKAYEVTQNVINTLTNENATLSSRYRSASNRLEQLQNEYKNQKVCANEIIPNDIVDAINLLISRLQYNINEGS